MENMDKLAPALVKAQSEIKAAKKDSFNPFYKSNYAGLGSVWEACKDALSKNGFSIIQTGAWRDGHFFLTTTLLHSSGQSVSGDYLIKTAKEDSQAYGSAWTYARRFSLAAIIGVINDEDDDGAATTATTTAASAAPSTAPATRTYEPVKQEGKDEMLTATFTPVKYGVKDFGEGDSKSTSYSVFDGKDYYSTKKPELGLRLKKCHDEGREVKIGYFQNGKYRNIATVNIPSMETVPF